MNLRSAVSGRPVNKGYIPYVHLIKGYPRPLLHSKLSYTPIRIQQISYLPDLVFPPAKENDIRTSYGGERQKVICAGEEDSLVAEPIGHGVFSPAGINEGGHSFMRLLKLIFYKLVSVIQL